MSKLLMSLLKFFPLNLEFSNLHLVNLLSVCVYFYVITVQGTFSYVAL